MSEYQYLKQARNFIAENKKNQALEVLWKLYESNNQKIRLDTILALLVALNHVTENEKLLEITEEGLKIASMLDKKDVEGYLLTEKCNFLLNKVGSLIYRQKNLKLSANVFKWIDFSTERERKEFKMIIQQRQKIEREMQKLEPIIFNFTKISRDHYFRGHIFSKLGDLYCLKFLNDQLDLVVGGKTKSMIGNIYFIRRWNLNKRFLFKSKDRKKIRDNKNKCIYFFKLSISELKAGGHEKEMAHACYNLAVKYKLIFCFRKARKFLKLAQELAERNNEKLLVSQIASFYKELKNKNKNTRNYIEEFGLDLP